MSRASACDMHAISLTLKTEVGDEATQVRLNLAIEAARRELRNG